jgi:hypothetical protein
MVEQKLKSKGGIQGRMGLKFHSKLFEIIEAKRANKTSPGNKDIQIEIITDLIIRNGNWKKLENEIINLDKEELKKLWN